MRELIHDLKFRDRHDARQLFGRWLVGAGSELLADADVIIPVPLIRSRLAARRFNQAALLAQEVARLSGVRYEPLALRRSRRTPAAGRADAPAAAGQRRRRLCRISRRSAEPGAVQDRDHR